MFPRLKAALWRLSMTGLSRGPHITRYAMYRRLAEVAAAFPLRTGKTLTISKSAKLAGILGLSDITEAEFPGIDMLSLPYPDASFDFVVSDQVLEHVAGDPQRAIDECHRVLRPGGIAVHTTCFINPVHKEPEDFWRFSPDALKYLSRNFSEVLDYGGWGNRNVWDIIGIGLRWDGIPHAAWHPLHKLAMKNDPAWPLSTWVVARK